ncbi:MAG: helix-turn-helix domain containing protein [Desulfovibrionaceae bacterium]|nr:helix-turn-helix domain containing protein [Desulfovibrionaceae bacterium]
MSTPLDRVFEAAGCRTQIELADFLGIKQSSISDAKRRGSIPADWLVALLRLKRVNPEWIMTGQGPRFLQPADYKEPVEPLYVYVKEIRPPEECTIEELIIEIIHRALRTPPNN